MLTDGVEEWRPVVGYEGFYEVSNLGRIRSLDRIEACPGRHDKPFYRRRSGRMLKTTTNKLGYVQVGLKKHGENKLKLVHRVVAEAFFLLRLVEVNHIDGVKSNNCLSNLEWSTRKLNSLHSTQVLMKNRGEDNNRAKLTEKEVLSIKQNLEDGFSQTEVARRYSVTNHAVFRIQHGYNWAWLTGYEKKGGSYVALN